MIFLKYRFHLVTCLEASTSERLCGFFCKCQWSANLPLCLHALGHARACKNIALSCFTITARCYIFHSLLCKLEFPLLSYPQICPLSSFLGSLCVLVLACPTQTVKSLQLVSLPFLWTEEVSESRLVRAHLWAPALWPSVYLWACVCADIWGTSREEKVRGAVGGQMGVGGSKEGDVWPEKRGMVGTSLAEGAVYSETSGRMYRWRARRPVWREFGLDPKSTLAHLVFHLLPFFLF